MGATRLGSIVVVVLLTMSGIVGANDDVDSEVLFQGNSDVAGPFWIEFSCKLDTCQDMELIVWTNDSQYRIIDTHLVEWIGLVNGSVSWEHLANPSLVMENFAMRSIIGEQSEIIENSDKEVPHKDIEKYSFVLVPLAEVMPNNIHPKLGIAFIDLLETKNFKSEVTKVY